MGVVGLVEASMVGWCEVWFCACGIGVAFGEDGRGIWVCSRDVFPLGMVLLVVMRIRFVGEEGILRGVSWSCCALQNLVNSSCLILRVSFVKTRNAMQQCTFCPSHHGFLDAVLPSSSMALVLSLNCLGVSKVPASFLPKPSFCHQLEKPMVP